MFRSGSKASNDKLGDGAAGGSVHGGSVHGTGNLHAGWLRTKGRDTGALASAVAGNRLQQMKSWNLWWAVLTRGTAPGAPPFTLRCYADETTAKLQARAGAACGASAAL